MKIARLALALIGVCCAGPVRNAADQPPVSETDTAQSAPTDDPGPEDLAPSSTDEVPPRATDPCAEFNRTRSRLSDEEHVRQFGCPPCPCACIDGRITCAPCAACVPIQPPQPRSSPSP